MVEASSGDTLGGVPVNEIETLDCRCDDGVAVEAKRRADLPWPFIFQGRHPELGLRFFRARRRGGQANGGTEEIEVWDVTGAMLRCLARRREKASERAKDEAARRLHRRGKVKVKIKPGVPTPERRRRGPLARDTIPNLEASRDGPPNVDLYRAPDRLVAMHKRGTLSAAQLEAAIRFHKAFIAGGCDPGQAANIHRVPGGKGAGLPGTMPDAMLDAKHEVFAIYDHLGGRDRLGARVLMQIVGLDRAIEDCVRLERGGDNWVNTNRVVGVLATALDSVAGYYATRAQVESLRARALKGAEIGVLSQGA